jgi:hypothetical protein
MCMFVRDIKFACICTICLRTVLTVCYFVCFSFTTLQINVVMECSHINKGVFIQLELEFNLQKSRGENFSIVIYNLI